MTLAPLLAAPLAVQIHTGAALAALVLGVVVLTRRKGDTLHRIGGRLWVGLMAVTALSTAWMGSTFVARHPELTLGGYGPIHILSLVTILSLIGLVAAARSGRISAHRKAVRSLYFFALIGAGLFTLIPGRIMGAAVFGW